MAEDYEFWVNKCSICFDARLDFSVERCKDQFCFNCFDRYVAELLNSAWGFSSFKVKCPVCSEVLSESEWRKYVRPGTWEKYGQLNRPFPVFTRFCSSCDTPNEAVKAPNAAGSEAEEVRVLAKEMELSGVFTRAQVDAFGRAMKACVFDGQGTIDALYKTFLDMYDVARKEQAESSSTDGSESDASASACVPGKRRRASSKSPSIAHTLPIAAISARLISLERSPESWRELQFQHLARFPKCVCSHCRRALCLKCGEGSWHRGLTCAGYLARRLSRAKGSVDTLASLQWKLENGKACPKCGVFIAREEGCNKVDCVSCGHRFCWSCMSAWSDDCGFYRCTQAKDGLLYTVAHGTQSDSNSGTVPRTAEEKPELGVPNVYLIHAKSRSQRETLI